MINRTWTILDGAILTPIFGDWRRLTESSDLRISEYKRDIISKVLGDTDSNIRGFMVETVLQAALLSSYKDEILSKDKCNTYHVDISIRRDNVLQSTNNTAILKIKTDNPVSYNYKGSITVLDNNQLLLTCNNKESYIQADNPEIKVNTDLSILYPSVGSICDTTFDIYTLPSMPALTIFYKRLLKYIPAYANEKSLIDIAGKFVKDMLL